jgi:hypothetical protein
MKKLMSITLLSFLALSGCDKPKAKPAAAGSNSGSAAPADAAAGSGSGSAAPADAAAGSGSAK